MTDPNDAHIEEAAVRRVLVAARKEAPHGLAEPYASAFVAALLLTTWAEHYGEVFYANEGRMPTEAEARELTIDSPAMKFLAVPLAIMGAKLAAEAAGPRAVN